jgi:hypothetical protein
LVTIGRRQAIGIGTHFKSRPSAYLLSDHLAAEYHA